MKEQALLMTEEGAISVTAQFVFASEKHKTSREALSSYELDFIVKDDTAYRDFLEGITLGVAKKCAHFAASGVPLDVPMDVQATPAPTLTCRDTRAGTGAALLGAPSVHESADEGEIFRVIQEIITQCLAQSRAFPQADANGVVTPPMSCIGRGAVNVHMRDVDELNAYAHEDQIWLVESTHGDCTLKELGFVGGSFIIFDPTCAHRSAALFDAENVCEAFRDAAPRYNISNTNEHVLDTTPQKIISPTDPPQKPKQNFFITLLSPLLMMAAMMASRLMMASNMASGMGTASLLVMSGAMCGATLIVTIINYFVHKKEHLAAVKEWREQYEAYIRALLVRIREKQTQDAATLQQLYPPKMGNDTCEGLVERIPQMNGEIYSRRADHPDFLAVRIGLSQKDTVLTPSVFAIEGEAKEVVFTDIRYKNCAENSERTPFSILLPDACEAKGDEPYLIDLPANIAAQYAYLKNAPVMLRLHSCLSVGLVLPQCLSFEPFIANILLELSYYHSPQDIQYVYFFPKETSWVRRQALAAQYKHLPHFNELLGDVSPFAFDEAGAERILNKLSTVLAARKEPPDCTAPHIVFILEEEYGFKRHPLSQYVPSSAQEEQAASAGISFVFCKRYLEHLPKYCAQVVHVTPNDAHMGAPDAPEAYTWHLVPHVQERVRGEALDDASRYAFTPDTLLPAQPTEDDREAVDAYYQAFKMLSAIHFDRIPQGVGVPRYVELYELLGDGAFAERIAAECATKEAYRTRLFAYLKALVLQQWGCVPGGNARVDITKSLAIPLGKKAGGERVYFDLHESESADGPHALLAGMTGSGKTEVILLLVVLLMAMFSPQQLNVLLVDMKGGNFAQRLLKANLPHIVGAVTNIDGKNNQTSEVTMMRRFLLSMKAEVTRREHLLSRMGVDSADGYINAKRNLEKHVATMQLGDAAAQDKLAELQKLEDLPHLVVVVDEFAELITISSESDLDFKKELSSLAREGRSLGMHILLASQQIEKNISSEIQSNTRAKLCLKVASRDTSKELLGSAIASDPFMPGNGRGFVATTSGRFEAFQSGYSGCDIARNLAPRVRLTYAPLSGNYELFYDSDDREYNPSRAAKLAQQREGITQLDLLAQAIASAYDSEACADMKTPFTVCSAPLDASICYDYNWVRDVGEVCHISLAQDGTAHG